MHWDQTGILNNTNGKTTYTSIQIMQAQSINPFGRVVSLCIHEVHMCFEQEVVPDDLCSSLCTYRFQLTPSKHQFWYQPGMNITKIKLALYALEYTPSLNFSIFFTFLSHNNLISYHWGITHFQEASYRSSCLQSQTMCSISSALWGGWNRTNISQGQRM